MCRIIIHICIIHTYIPIAFSPHIYKSTVRSYQISFCIKMFLTTDVSTELTSTHYL